MKKLLTIGVLAFIALLLVTSTAFAGGENESSSAGGNGDGYEIATIIDMGIIDDKGFNQGAWMGVKAYGEENGISHKYYVPAEKTTDAYLSAIDLAVQGGARVIVTPGFRFQEPVFIAQASYTDVNFILLDGIPSNRQESLTGENTVSVKYAEEESGFLAGYAAVMDGNTKLGFMGGMAVPAVVRFGYGFVQGADEAAKELGLSDVEINYYYTGTFDATPQTQTLAATWLHTGTQVIFACGSGVGQSVMAACEAASPRGKTIGVDIDWADESDTIITSAMKSLTPSVYQMLGLYYSGEFPGGQNVVMDAASNGVALPMGSSRFETFSKDDYDALYAKLSDRTYDPVADTDSNGNSISLSDLPVEAVTVNEI